MAQKIVTPKGELNWVFINGNPKKDLNGNDRYSVALHFPSDSPDLKLIEDKVNAYWEENKPKGQRMKSNGIKACKDKEGNLTGYTDVVFWTGTRYPDGKEKVIKTFNAKNKEVHLDESVRIGNGSIGRVSGSMDLYSANKAEGGVTLYLNAIQITKLVEYGANDFAEVEEEDGWTGDEGTEFDDTEEVTDAPKMRL